MMKYDRRVRFAALVDKKGRILEGGMREGVQPIEPLEKTPELIARLVSLQKTDLAEFLGRLEYSILVHEDITAMIFRSKRTYALVTVDRRFALDKVSGLSKLATAWERD
jgi:hypothetical protein